MFYLNDVSSTLDHPPAYQEATNEDLETSEDSGGTGLILATGLNPFPGFRRRETRSILERMQTSIDLPDNLIIAKKCLVTTMSVLYSTMLVVTCIVLVTTETISRIYDPLKKYHFKGFYTYLYGGSILFMCYIFFYVLRYRVRGRDQDQLTEQMEMENFIQQMMRATGLQMRESEGRPGDPLRTRRLALVNGEDTEDKPPTEMVVKLMTSESEKSHGGILMRLGAIGFGLGTLIYAGLEFVNSFETPYHCSGWNVLSAANPVLQMIFTFMQMYYIFMHSRLNINKNKIIAKFGLMHLIATNGCIWINSLVKESMNEILESSEFKKLIGNETFDKMAGRVVFCILYKKYFHVLLGHSLGLASHCDKVDILGDTIENSSVYLFPFIIEFSMIGAHIVFNMWKNVGKKPKFAMVGENYVEEKGRPWLLKGPTCTETFFRIPSAGPVTLRGRFVRGTFLPGDPHHHSHPLLLPRQSGGLSAHRHHDSQPQ